MKPLSDSTRNRFMLLLVGVFVVAAPFVIGYASGFRFDGAFSLVKTGGVFIHSNEPNTRIFIDDEFVESNGFLLRNTLVQNLTPGKTYTVRVEKDNYYWWEKTLYVRPNLVTEARLLMLPREHVWNEIFATTTLDVDPDALIEATTSSGIAVDDIATTTASSSVANPEYEALVEFFEEDRQQFEVDVATTTLVATTTGKGRLATTTLVASTTIVTEIQLPEYFDKEEYELIDFETKQLLREKGRVAAWLQDGNVYAVWLGEEYAKPFYFCVLTCKNTIVVDWVDPIKRFAFYPDRDDVVLVLNDKGLHAVELDDRSRQNIQTLIEGENLDFRVRDGSDIIVWDKTNSVFLELVE